MTDEEALQLVKNGRQEGYVALYDRYAPYLFTVAWRMLGSREQAEDALQEAFSSAFRSIGEFQGRSRLKTWLFTILFRTSLRLRETISKSQTAPLPEEGVPVPDDVCRIEQRLLVEQVLDRLPERDRAVLIMAYWDDLTCGEISGVLGLKENHVKILLYRARAKFGALWPESAVRTSCVGTVGGNV